jgi:hypothetical protein
MAGLQPSGTAQQPAEQQATDLQPPLTQLPPLPPQQQQQLAGLAQQQQQQQQVDAQQQKEQHQQQQRQQQYRQLDEGITVSQGTATVWLKSSVP